MNIVFDEGRRSDLWIRYLLHISSHLHLAFSSLLSSATHELLVFSLLLTELHGSILIDHVLNDIELLLVESVVISLLADSISTMSQGTLVVNLIALLHQDTEVVCFTLLGFFGTFQVLL